MGAIKEMPMKVEEFQRKREEFRTATAFLVGMQGRLQIVCLPKMVLLNGELQREWPEEFVEKDRQIEAIKRLIWDDIFGGSVWYGEG